ncbi:GntR family transcriptional regulator [Streptomyces flavofungini]|uniref:GntR family transcriptional regulator n=1 Tax=Streptomyces flavofungini TaxID=68200 RepID=UPI0034DE8DF1
MPVALYRRIADDIRRRIAAGEWSPGQPLPSRAELAAAYHVHEQTMRLTYDLLRRTGVLEGEERKRVIVAHPPAVRTLTDLDAPWPYTCDVTDTRPQPATEELAERLGVPVRTMLQHEAVECLDPGGLSGMLANTWWQGRRRGHATFTAELETVRLTQEQAHALGLLVDTLAYRVARTRLDTHGTPVETSDLFLPMDRWRIRLKG